MPAPLVEVLDDQGIATPFPVQVATLPDALAGRDILGRARTGSGKTLGFSLPLVSRLAGGSTLPARPRGLVLVPTRELATQVSAVLKPLARSMNLWVTTIYGGVSYGPQVNALQHRTNIVVATPGRLADLIGQGECDLSDVGITVIDEADQMADLGFLPIVRRLLETTPADGQRMLFSATLDAAIDVLARRFLHDPVLHSVDENSSPAEIEHHVLTVDAANRIAVIAALVGGEKRSLVFTRTKHGAERLARQLTEAGIPAAELHGNLRQGARSKNLAAFASGLARVMVATDIAARGIHIDGIDLVIHADPPTEHKAYVHRSGRTARGGADGVVVTLQTKAQARDLAAMMRKADITPHPVVAVDADSDVLTEIAGPPAPRVTVAGKISELVRPEDRLASNDRPGTGSSGRPRRDRGRDHGREHYQGRGRDHKPRDDRFRDRTPRDFAPRDHDRFGAGAGAGPATSDQRASTFGRPATTERPARAERPERDERQARDDRPARADRFERDSRPSRDERPEREARAPQPASADRFERPAREDRDRLARFGGDDRPARFDRGDRLNQGNFSQGNQGHRFERGDSRGSDSRGSDSRESGGPNYGDRQDRWGDRNNRDSRGGNSERGDRGSDSTRSDSRGSDSRGSDSRGSDGRGPASRGPASRGFGDRKYGDRQDRRRGSGDNRGGNDWWPNSGGRSAQQGARRPGSPWRPFNGGSQGNGNRATRDDRNGDDRSRDDRARDSWNRDDRGRDDRNRDDRGRDDRNRDDRNRDDRNRDDRGRDDRGRDSWNRDDRSRDDRNRDDRSRDDRGRDNRGRDNGIPDDRAFGGNRQSRDHGRSKIIM